MINNRLLRETGEDLINYLNQIPAEDILPHRDRAELQGRIRRRHDRRHHQNHAEAQTRQRDRRSGRHLLFARLFKRFSTTSPSFNLNYRNDRLSLYASMGTWFGKQIVRITESSAFEQNDASIRSESRLDGRWKSVSPRIGALYEFNDRHSAGLEVSYFRNLPGGSETHNRLQKQDKADSTRIASHFLQNQQGYGLGFRRTIFSKWIPPVRCSNCCWITTGATDDPTDYFQPLYRVAGVRHHLPGRHPYGQRPLCGHRRFRNRARSVSKLRTGAKYTLNRMNTAILYEFLRDDAWHRIDRQSNLNRYSGKHRGAVRRFFD